MSAHTEGPWSVVTGRANIGGHGHKCWLVGQKAGDVGCAVVILPDEDDTPEARIERKATANLVAAAPDLLGALEALSPLFGFDDPIEPGQAFVVNGDNPALMEAFKAASAAIRKARGEA